MEKSQVDLVGINYAADFAKAQFEAFTARGFKRDEALKLTIEAVKAGFQQGEKEVEQHTK